MREIKNHNLVGKSFSTNFGSAYNNQPVEVKIDQVFEPLRKANGYINGPLYFVKVTDPIEQLDRLVEMNYLEAELIREKYEKNTKRNLFARIFGKK